MNSETSPEPVRLVIWDLDDTFWRGTLSEAGIKEYVAAHHDIVIELARRGIMSSICSKNDLAPVKAILEQRGIWDYFIFPSIDWSPKGARVRALIEAVRLRPQTVMFIDDHPGNRAEVAERLPAVQVEDENFIASLLEDSRFAGKDDRKLARLAQYKLLEQRQRDEEQAAGNNLEFLRNCDIRVVIDTDVEAHIDRAIELINRTNQLNFTKNRLPQDPEAAREALRAALKHWATVAGLVRVGDRYGDYGYCGFYLVSRRGMNNPDGKPRLDHFCFSCRALGMGIEQFVYQRIGRPRLKIAGKVVSDPADPAVVDWIRLETKSIKAKAAGIRLPEIRLRGGCEMELLGHYFGLAADRVTRESNLSRGPLFVRIDSSALMAAALTGGYDSAQLGALGYQREDFTTSFLDAAVPGTWLVLSMWADVGINHYEHRASGVRVPCEIAGLWGLDLCGVTDQQAAARRIADGHAAELPEEISRIIQTLRSEFRFHGALSPDEIAAGLRRLLGELPGEARLIIWLPSEFNKSGVTRRSAQLINQAVRRVGADFPAVRFVATDDVVPPDQERQQAFDHFDRQVYFRVFRRMVEIIESEA